VNEIKRLRMQDLILDRLTQRGPSTFADLYRLGKRVTVDEAIVQLVAAGLVRWRWGKNGVVVELVKETKNEPEQL
jgi:hypothetical protein